jgi:Domain of unknown function (DUF4911)
MEGSLLGTTRWVFLVNREDIHYLRTTIESYDGMAVVRTVNPAKAVIELLIAPGCEDLVSALLAAMRDEEAIRLEAIGSAQSIERRAERE